MESLSILDHRWWLSFFVEAGADWVLQILLFLGVLVIGVLLERLVYIAVRQGRPEELAQLLREALAPDAAPAARQRLDAALNARWSVPAAVVRAGYAHVRAGDLAAAQQLIQAALREERLRLERGLAILGTLGNNTPFIGLFGTVLGIIKSFRDLSENITAGSAAVMAGIAEALVATAVGLLVAIPAVIAYNFMQRQVKALLERSQVAAEVLLAARPAPEAADGPQQ